MKKTRRFVALLLAAVLALALFTACGAAEQPQSAIGKVYEDWFVEQINSKRPAVNAELAERLFQENEEARQAMVRQGVLREIAGRFSALIRFQPLDAAARLAIAVKQIISLGQEFGLRIIE